jgi:hypothetical protein
MGPTLEKLIEQGKQIKTERLFHDCDDFWEWHESCLEFLNQTMLSFREQVTSPRDAGKGVEWLQSTFRCNGDNHQ